MLAKPEPQQSAALAARLLWKSQKLGRKHPEQTSLQQQHETQYEAIYNQKQNQLASLHNETINLRSTCQQLAHRLTQLESSTAVTIEAVNHLDNDFIAASLAASEELARVARLEREKSAAADAVAAAASIQAEIEHLRQRLADSATVEWHFNALRSEALEVNNLRRQIAHAFEAVDSEKSSCRRLEAERSRLLGNSNADDNKSSVEHLKLALEEARMALSEQRRSTCRIRLQSEQLAGRLDDAMEPEAQRLREQMQALQERRDELLAEQQQQFLLMQIGSNSQSLEAVSDSTTAASSVRADQVEEDADVEQQVLLVRIQCGQWESAIAAANAEIKSLCGRLDQLDASIMRHKLAPLSNALHINQSNRVTGSTKFDFALSDEPVPPDTPGSRFMARQRNL